MSRIIKAGDGTSVTLFGFQDIAEEWSDDNPMRANFTKNCEAEDVSSCEEAEVSEADRMAELEAVIHNRLLEAERQAQELEKEAYEKGFEQGRRDGLEYAEKSLAITMEQLESIMEGLRTLPEKILSDYRDWLTNAAMALAKRIVKREISTRPDFIVEIVTGLLEEADTDHRHTVYVSPPDMEVLENNMHLIKKSLDSRKTFTISTDAELERGGCRIENDIQSLDASLSTRFELLEKALKDNGRSPDDELPSQ